MSLPTDSRKRKNVPLATGCFDYFPDALAAVAELSRIGNEQHNPGKPLHWDRSKSTDEADALARHFVERGKLDTDGVRHSTKVAWRALALLQKEIEADNGHVAVKNDGWIPWEGGECPVPADTKVEVRLLNGDRVLNLCAGSWVWEHCCGAYNIVAYRVDEDR